MNQCCKNCRFSLRPTVELASELPAVEIYLDSQKRNYFLDTELICRKQNPYPRSLNMVTPDYWCGQYQKLHYYDQSKFERTDLNEFQKILDYITHEWMANFMTASDFRICFDKINFIVQEHRLEVEKQKTAQKAESAKNAETHQ